VIAERNPAVIARPQSVSYWAEAISRAWLWWPRSTFGSKFRLQKSPASTRRAGVFNLANNSARRSALPERD